MPTDSQRQDQPESVPQPVRGVVVAGKRIYRQSMRDDVMGLAAELAYRFFLALFPFFIFLTALGGSVAAQLPVENPAQSIVQFVGNTLPEQAAEAVQAELENIINNQNPGVLSLGAVLALFFATGGTNAIIKALDRVYSVDETRPIWKRYVMAIGLTLVAGISLIGAFVLLGPLRVFAPQIAELVGLGDAAGAILMVVTALLGFVLVALAAGYVYRVAPNIELPLRDVLPGALLFAIAWALATVGFFVYVTNFGNYGGTYGALAGVVIVLVWFYLSALIFLVAGEVNQVLHEMRDPVDVQNRRRASQAAGERAAEDSSRRQTTRTSERRHDETDEEGAATA